MCPASTINVVEETLRSRSDLAIRYDPPVLHSRGGLYSDTPEKICPPVATLISNLYPNGLFRHQARAIESILAEKNTVVATSTSSGKSLIYSVPILQSLVADPRSCSLLIFPQKALANDQLEKLASLVRNLPETEYIAAKTPEIISRYDGGIPEDRRKSIQQTGQIILTNPDMLHYGILPWHEKLWSRVFKSLKYIVIDECHEYKGVFGANVAYILRRLRAICKHHGSTPTIVASSATIHSPKAHIEKLAGATFESIPASDDGSIQGMRKLWMVQPQGHPYDLGRTLTVELVEKGLTVLVFCLARAAAEQIYVRTSGEGSMPREDIRVYRAGLTTKERESVEKGFKAGTIKAVFATSAMELGIDIGAIDVVICIGFPATSMSLWQRAGRAGRGGRESSIVLIPAPTPLDAYYLDNPEDYVNRQTESISVGLENKRVVHSHYACAAKELLDEERLDFNIFGPEFAAVHMLRSGGKLTEEVFYLNDPHRSTNVRGAGDELYYLVCNNERIGEIDALRLLSEAPRNGVYLHGGSRYRVLDVNSKTKIVKLAPEPRPVSTRSKILIDIRERQIRALRVTRHLTIGFGRLDVKHWLAGVSEQHISGEVLRSFPGSGMPNNWLPTEGTFFRLDEPFWKDLADAVGSGHGGLVADAAARLFESLLPTVVGPCESSDYRAVAFAGKQGFPVIYLYDSAPYGIGITAEVFGHAKGLVSRAIDRVQHCECDGDTGCFKCVRNTRVDEPSSKVATLAFLRALECEFCFSCVETKFDDAVAEIGEKVCRVCNSTCRAGMRFCGNCGQRLEE